MKKCAALMCIAVLSHMSVLADIVVGRWELVTNNVAQGEVKALDPASRILLGEENGFSKTGAGTWQLPAGSISQAWPFEMAVKSGTLQITDTQVPAPATGLAVEAPPVMQRAGIWLEADDETKFVATAAHGNIEGRKSIDAWHDRRETDVASPSYPYAKAYYNSSDLAPWVSEYAGRPTVYFGGVTSGACMDLVNPSGTLFCGKGSDKYLNCVKSVFIAHGVEKTHGWLLGQTANIGGGYFIWWGKYADTGLDFNIFSEDRNRTDQGMISALTRNCRQWLNGKATDFFKTQVSVGAKLYEMAWDYDGVVVNTLMAERRHHSANVGFRAGGDHIYAVVAFTNIITEAERVQVRDYLMRKYLPEASLAATKARSVALSEGATVEVPDTAFADCPPDRAPLSLKGGGTAFKTGSGRLVVGGDYGEERFCGQIQAEEGSLSLRDDIALAAVPGIRLDTDSGLSSTGMVVSVSGAAESDEFETAGDRITVKEIPGGVAKVKVDSGILRLTGEKNTACGAAVPFEVAIADHGFEIGNAWTITGSSGCYAYLGLPSDPWNCYFSAPEGSKVLRVRYDACISQNIVIPMPGKYELTYYTSGRGDNGGHELDISLTHKPSGKVYRLANVAAPLVRTGHGMVKLHFPVAVEASGEYKLEFKNPGWTNDKTTFIDDVHLTKIEESPAWIWNVPNGDFEQIDYRYGGHGHFASATMTSNAKQIPGQIFSVSNTVPGWTYCLPSGWTDAADASLSLSEWVEPPVAVAALSMSKINGASGNNDVYFGTSYRDGSALYLMNATDLRSTGAAQLHFHYACAESAVTTEFVPPKGCWQVAMHMGRTNHGSGGIKVSAKTGAGEWTDLGTVEPDDGGRRMKQYTWPGFITSDGASSVTLKIEPAGVAAGCQGCNVDNVVLTGKIRIPVANAEIDDIVWDGNTGKYVPSGWDCTVATHKNGSTQWKIEATSDYTATVWGDSSWGGGGRVSVIGRSILSQRLFFPAAGVYRLSFAHCRRFDSSKINTVEVCLVSGGETPSTNLLTKVKVHSPRFCQSKVDFSIPAAGEYALMFRGTYDDYASALFDDFRVERMLDCEFGSTSIASSTKFDIAGGATLELEFSGTNKVSSFRYAGRPYSGVIDASNCPGIRGFGALEVVPKGLMIIVK